MKGQKVVSSLMNEMVKAKLYESGTEVTGHTTYIVSAMCMTDEAEDAIPQQFSLQASSPEEAKRRAMEISKEMGHKSCRISDVKMVPNSDEELNRYGSGSALNADPEAMAGQVKPSDISSSLPDGDA